MIIEESAILKRKLKSIIEFKNFETKFDKIEVNKNVPFTFSKEDYKTKEGRPKYTGANKFGKSGAAIAVITKNTISQYYSKNIEYPEPINFEKLVGKNDKEDDENIGIFQKCHTIGYHLSAKITDFNNVFIGTQKLNNGAMNDIEEEIVKIVRTDNRKILYKVTPIYMFKRDIVPFGLLFEYESIDKKEKIKFCQFCYNVQPNHKINYFNGSNIRIEDIQMPETDEVKTLQNKSKASSKRKKYKNYYLDIRTKTFHLIFDEKEKCQDLKGVSIKFIQEVTGDKEEILRDEKHKICEKCEKMYNIRFGKK